MADQTLENAYALDAGKLYIASGNLSEAELRQDKYYAGETLDGCRVKYTAKVHEITNDAGEVIDRVRYGEKMTVSGSLKKIRLTCLAALCGCRSQFDSRSHHISPGAKSARGKKGLVSAMIVCPLPDETEFSLYVRGSATSGADMTLSNDRTGGIGFEISSVHGADGAVGSLSVRVG